MPGKCHNAQNNARIKFMHLKLDFPWLGIRKMTFKLQKRTFPICGCDELILHGITKNMILLIKM